MINYSIIIPHFGSKELLVRCLNSIPKREDIETIVFEDTMMQGAGWARNQALKNAHGKWLIFADSDDYFEPRAFDFFDTHIEDEADIIFFNVTSRFSDTGLPSNREQSVRPLLEQYVPNNHETEMQLRLNFHEPWAKMIRHSLVTKHKLRFEEVRWANDVQFTTRIGYYAQSIAVDMHIVYCVTVTKGSLVHQRSIESRRCRYEVMLRTNQWLREMGLPQYQHSIMYSLRRAAAYGPKVLWDFIQLGRSYDAQFFIGWNQWLQNAWKSIVHNEDKGKKNYITK